MEGATIGAVSKASPLFVLIVGLTCAAYGVVLLISRQRTLRSLGKSPGIQGHATRYKFLANLNGLVVPIALVPIGLAIAIVGAVRL